MIASVLPLLLPAGAAFAALRAAQNTESMAGSVNDRHTSLVQKWFGSELTGRSELARQAGCKLASCAA